MTPTYLNDRGIDLLAESRRDGLQLGRCRRPGNARGGLGLNVRSSPNHGGDFVGGLAGYAGGEKAAEIAVDFIADAIYALVNAALDGADWLGHRASHLWDLTKPRFDWCSERLVIRVRLAGRRRPLPACGRIPCARWANTAR
jgi:hypothetical protein